MTSIARTRVVIMGAAGRDFHNFNVVFRDDRDIEVTCFTAAQIPGIDGRTYPPTLAGALYPAGIPIHEEAELPRIMRDDGIETVVFAYSDVAHVDVMHRASTALAAGADFLLLGPRRTMMASRLPVIAVCAVRTGCGKSQTARWLAARLRERGLRVGVLRHPMPYGDLERQAVQRFATLADLDAANCTIEEREEYEPHIAAGGIVHVGVDTARVLAQAEAESDLLLWDGGNNDFPFLRPDLLIVLVDPLRPGDESTYHPGEAVLRMADIVLVAKTNAVSAEAVRRVAHAARAVNPSASILYGASLVTLDDPAAVRGRHVLVVEDGPTLTHGGMPHGAGYVAALAAGAAGIVDPRLSATPEIAAIFAAFPHLGPVLPAMGYDAAQRRSLAETIARSTADLVVSATPADLQGVIGQERRVVRARYSYAEAGTPGLGSALESFLLQRGMA